MVLAVWRGWLRRHWSPLRVERSGSGSTPSMAGAAFPAAGKRTAGSGRGTKLGPGGLGLYTLKSGRPIGSAERTRCPS